MACTPTIKLPVPTLGGGLSFSPPTVPSFSGSLDLCCKSVQFATPPLPIPLPPFTLNPVFNGAIKAGMAGMQAWIDAHGIDCPLE